MARTYNEWLSSKISPILSAGLLVFSTTRPLV